jgi:hypothetical protein
VASADAAGFTRYWLAQHHTLDAAHSSPDLLVALFADITEQIRIGVAGVPRTAPKQPADPGADTVSPEERKPCELQGFRVRRRYRDSNPHSDSRPSSAVRRFPASQPVSPEIAGRPFRLFPDSPLTRC